jgi:uncharacterized protein (DUF58 family)
VRRVRAWLQAARAAAAAANAVRPTFAGTWYLLVLAGVTFGAVNTGNNLVYVVLAALLSVLVVNNLLAEWNLRGLEVRRELPEELFAETAAVGRFVLRNTRRVGAAWGVELSERGHGGAEALVGRAGPGEERGAEAAWVLPVRGMVRLGRVRVGSRFPFGIILRYRDLDVLDEVLVYPRPADAPVDGAATGRSDGTATVRTRDAAGDFAGLRPYRAGDPVRRIHWRSSARAGGPLVVQRAGEAGGEVVVRVDPRAGEPGISAACGAVLTHTRRGDAVGLEPVGAEARIPPRTGAAHRRRLLSALALLPPSDAGVAARGSAA